MKSKITITRENLSRGGQTVRRGHGRGCGRCHTLRVEAPGSQETSRVEGGSYQEIRGWTVHEKPIPTQPTIEDTTIGGIEENLGTLPLAPQVNQKQSRDNIVSPLRISKMAPKWKTTRGKASHIVTSTLADVPVVETC